MIPRQQRALTTGAAPLMLLLASTSVAQDGRPPAPPLRTDTIARVARLRTSAVVTIHTRTPEFGWPAPLLQPTVEGLGSGVVIDAKGLVLTNAHVIAGATAIHLRTPDGVDVAATVVGTDAALDLALLRAADARGLRPAPLGDSNHVQVGDWVVAIGNPLGLHHTVTVGIVSAKARTLDDSGVEYLQTDAAVSPGSSGGPLLDLSGRVIGINVGLLSTGGQNVGLNVAIPAALVKEVLPYLRGEVVHGWIGVTTVALSAHHATERGLRSGLALTAVTADGPAQRAGLRPSDILTGFVDYPAWTLNDFYQHIRSRAPGTVLRLSVWRDGDRLVLPVEIGRRP